MAKCLCIGTSAIVYKAVKLAKNIAIHLYLESEKEKAFNKRLSGIRTMCTENLIGLWKNRYGIYESVLAILYKKLNLV
jgi:hypothetical protein